ncbi:MAG: DUF1700 domain-containing protein [Pseudomonadota bacterium]
MGKLEFLDALKRAMTGLAPELQAKTLAYYEQRFVDGVAAGQAEADIAKAFDDPKKIAMTLRASTHMKAFEEKKNPANALRMLVAVVGLAIFNLFMVVPAIVYASLLFALYVCGLAFYSAGIIITASGLSGANEVALSGPLREIFVQDDGDRRNVPTKVLISSEGVRVSTDPLSERDEARAADAEARAADAEARAADADARAEDAVVRAADAAARAAESAGRKAVQAGVVAAGEAAIAAAEDAAREVEAAIDDVENEERGTSRAMRRVESVAGEGITISTDMDDESRATQTVVGLAMVLGGIILFLLSLVVTRYTFIGIKRYIQMNFSLLKGN